MSIVKRIIKIFLILLLIIVLLAAIYVAYYLLSYKRIDDNLPLTAETTGGTETAATDSEYTAISYNIGFGAYTKNFGFFMDGGTSGRADSYDSVVNDINSIISLLQDKNADVMIVEEVDLYATRSYHVDEKQMFLDAFTSHSGVYAVNYDSPYLIYPFNSPLGSAKSGIMTLSKFSVTSSLRRQFPVESGFAKYMDLDRCYTVTRTPVENGKELVIYAVHLSAYTSDGTIADEQFSMLIEDMKSEYDKGNYVLCGGDFNKDLLGDSSAIFGVSSEGYTWAQPIKEEYLDGTGLSLVKPLNGEGTDTPVPTCRNADGPYNENQFVITIDGFIVSDNITISSVAVIDTGFEYSDHNPVTCTFSLNS